MEIQIGDLKMPILKVDNVSKSFKSKKSQNVEVLENISFEINNGLL